MTNTKTDKNVSTQETYPEFYISYADIEACVQIDCRGVGAQSIQQAEELVRAEAKAVISLRTHEQCRPIADHDINIYWKNISSNAQYPFTGDALALYNLHTMNRHPMTIKGE